MSKMETSIRDVDGVTSVLSYHTLTGSGIPDFFIPETLRDMLKQGGHQLMMVNSDTPTASDAVADQLDQIGTIVRTYDPKAMITGEASLTKDLISTSAVDFKMTNLISLGAILLIVAMVFQSLTVPLVLVSTIELAIFINQGVPYFTGAKIPFVAPTIIGCVQLGATVDYAILITTRFQEELQKGKKRQEAIRIAATAADPAIITSSLVLFCATLGVGLVSKIEIISSICIMHQYCVDHGDINAGVE